MNPNTILTDARGVRDKMSTEKGGLQQKALTLEIPTIREYLVNSGAQIGWTTDENMITKCLTKDHRESRKHLAQILQEGELSRQKNAAHIRGVTRFGSQRTRKLRSDSSCARRTKSGRHARRQSKATSATVGRAWSAIAGPHLRPAS